MTNMEYNIVILADGPRSRVSSKESCDCLVNNSGCNEKELYKTL